MLMSYLSFAPEILLLLCVVVLQIVKIFRKEQTPKTFASISKIFWIIVFACCIIFYNVNGNKNFYMNSEYTTAVKAVLLCFVITMNILAHRWFLNQNYNSCFYYQLVNLLLISLFTAISCRHLGILAGSMSAIFVITALMSGIAINIKEKQKLKQYTIINCLVSLSMIIIGALIIYIRADTLQYNLLQNYYQTHQLSQIDYLGMTLVLGALFCMIGAFPFHLIRLKIQSYNILPVASLICILLPLTGIIFLLQNLSLIFGKEVLYLREMMTVCGVATLILGAIGSGSGNNLRQIINCVSLFNVGIILLLMASFETNLRATIGVYILMMFVLLTGVYTCFYGCRSQGKYLRALDDFSGLAETKPYLSGVILIFCCSLMGLPPFLGMIENIIVVKTLLVEKTFLYIGGIFLLQIWVVYGMLRIITTLYFTPRTKFFERIDTGVSVCILLNIIVMLLILTHMEYVVNNFRIFMEK